MADCDKTKGKRSTRIVRAQSQGSWVDLEVLESGSFAGAQWKGISRGNLAQETILGLAEDLTGDRGSDTVQMTNITGNVVDIKTKASALFLTREGFLVERHFLNSNKGKDKNPCRDKPDKTMKKRIAFNNIDKRFLDNQGNPPKDPKKYKDAVTKSKDQGFIWLDVEIPKDFHLSRDREVLYQDIGMTNVWGNGGSSLPGGFKKTDESKPHLRLDPYQVAINFGPDGLAVAF